MIAEHVSVSRPDIWDMPRMEWEPGPLGWSAEALERYEEWSRHMCQVEAVIMGEERARAILAAIEAMAERDCEGRLRADMRLAGAEGDVDGLRVYYRIEVGMLQAEEAYRMAEEIRRLAGHAAK